MPYKQLLKPLFHLYHIDEIPPNEFYTFLNKIKQLDIAKDFKIEVSEKIDGSCAINFGIGDGKFFAATKRTDLTNTSFQMPESVTKIAAACKAIEKQTRAISEGKDIHVRAEGLYTTIPNTLEYSDNRIIFYDAAIEGSNQSSQQICQLLEKEVGNSPITVDGEKWHYSYKPIVDPKTLMVDIEKEYKDVTDILSDVENQLLLKKRVSVRNPKEKAQKEALIQNIKNIQTAVKDKLVQKIKSLKSVYGPTKVEGVVIKDLESDLMVKIVNQDYFTTLNKIFWYVRLLLTKGLKTSESDWKWGITGEMYVTLSDILHINTLKNGSGIASAYIKKQTADVPGDADERLLFYIKNNAELYKESYSVIKGSILSLCDKLLKDTENLQDRWEAVRDTPIEIGDKDIIRTPEIVKKRNDKAFDETYELLMDIKESVQDIDNLKTEEGKKVALLKLILGERGIQKLSESKMVVSEDMDSQEKYAVVVGRFQPPHAGHIKMIKNILSKGYNKLIILVAGNIPGPDNPLDFETREAILGLSLPSQEHNVVVEKVEGSVYVPEFVEKLNFEPGSSFDIYCGPDRIEMYKIQVKHYNERDDKHIFNVVPIARERFYGGMSGTKAREAIARQDVSTIQKMFDLNFLHSPQFDDIYSDVERQVQSYL